MVWSLKSVLVTGSSRGIGFELVKRLTKSAQVVFACCRSPETSHDLKNFASNHDNVKVVALDVTNEDSIKSAFEEVSALLNGSGLTCLINNAGILYRSSFVDFSADNCKEVFLTNSIGPALVTQKFLPLIKKAATESTENEISVSRAAILNISSTLGSISEATFSSPIEYRMSKAALNMLTKTLAFELKSEKILVASLCPGWVQTDMGGPTAHRTLDLAGSDLLALFEKLNESNTGLMTRWNGQVVEA
ncbi:C-signal isoform X1 [Hydra vulgaris]|uniref:C-signal isoform X1 n=1 Tax=Hydra vulgaris TaxID=6087 RepID=UPI0002B45A6C|nr:C-factor [Hydra vulgaris]XP_047144038.1 C-factor [Hydra vulgaris]